MKSQEIQRIKNLDKKYIWHPFTPMLDWLEDDPLVIERGEGAWLYDIEGRRYLDGVSSLWVTVHGHRHPKIDAAVREQLDRIAHTTMLGLGNVPGALLAERLVEIAPRGLKRVFYSDSGSEAVEIAVKMAFQYWRQCSNPKPAKTRFVSFTNAYHGDTVGSVSVGGIDLFHKMYKPLLFNSFHAPSPYCYRCELGKTYPECSMNCLDKLEEILEHHADEIAAVICEPLIQAAAGIITAPRGYLRRVRELCDRFDVLLIADEVAVGFGRTGTMFACEAEGVTPDLMALAKGLTGGYLPLAATLANDRVFEAFLTRYEDRRTFYHGHTYTGNPLACAAAIANLDLFKEENTLERLAPRIELLAHGLEKIAAHDHVGDIRQRGVMVGIEIVKVKSTKELFDTGEKIGVRICSQARQFDVIIRPLEHVVVLNPPLCVDDDQIDMLIDAVGRAIERVT